MRLLDLKEAKTPGHGITVEVWTDLQISFYVMKEGLPVVALTIYEQVPEHYANHPIARNTVYRVNAKTQDGVGIAELWMDADFNELICHDRKGLFSEINAESLKK